MSRRNRVTLALAGAAAFGLVAAWAKGPGTSGVGTMNELRSVLGNVSTPWLLVGFLAGAQARRIRSGALLGLAATLVALFSFYLLATVLTDLGNHGFVADLRLELTANRVYLEGGLVSGPLLGGLGAWWSSRRTLGASIVAGALMMAEPLVALVLAAVHQGVLSSETGLPLLVRIVPGWGLTYSRGPIWLGVSAAEFALGLVLVAVAVRARLATRRAD